MLDFQRFIHMMTPTRARKSIQVMADHSHNWYDGATTRKGSNDSSDDINMQKLNGNIHVVQVRKYRENTELNLKKLDAITKSLEVKVKKLTQTVLTNEANTSERFKENMEKAREVKKESVPRDLPIFNPYVPHVPFPRRLKEQENEPYITHEFVYMIGFSKRINEEELELLIAKDTQSYLTKIKEHSCIVNTYENFEPFSNAQQLSPLHEESQSSRSSTILSFTSNEVKREFTIPHSYAAIAPKLDSRNFNKWKRRILCYLARMEPYYLKCIEDDPFHPKTAEGDAKPESHWILDERRVEEVSKDEEVTQVKVLMALADDELTVGKSHARNGEWVDIAIRKMYIASLRSENYKDQPYQYPSSSKKILKAKAKPFPPCTHYGFNDYRPDDYRNYREYEICGSCDHSISRHNRVIHIRGGVLAESSQSNESSILVMCNTCGSTVHSTSNHNEFDHFKRGKKAQAAKAREPTKSEFTKETNPSLLFVQRHIREPIWYLDSECSRSMTGVNSYLHKYVEQPGPKVVFGDNSSCITEGYGSINCGVIVDEYSRYTWVYFISKKSQALEMIMSFVKMVENQNDIKVKQIKTDNGTEFKNYELESFCNEKVISQNFSSPYTPEQDGVAKRKNKTPIEAARTMLNRSVLSMNFCTEVVKINCYTQNRTIIVKRQDKTPYEIFRERIPDISHFHVFGCPVFVHNYKDHLGKFNAKANDGYFLGYSSVSKAFRIYNTRRQKIKETYHIQIDESIEAISPMCKISVLSKGITSNSREKNPQSIAMSSVEAEYVAVAGCCANIIWMKSQLIDYDIHYKMVHIFCDNNSAIAISNNPNFLREFWSTVAFDCFPSTDEPKKHALKEFLIKFSVSNRQRPLTLDFQTLCSSTSLDYNNGKYVEHPTPEVLDENYFSTKQVNSIQQLLAYSVIIGNEVDIGEIIYSDLRDLVSLSPLVAKPRKGSLRLWLQPYPSHKALRLQDHPLKREQNLSPKYHPLRPSNHHPSQQRVLSNPTQVTWGQRLRENKPPVDMEPLHTTYVDLLRTCAKYQEDQTQSSRLRYRSLTKNEGKPSYEGEPDIQPLILYYEDVRAILLSEHEAQESDKEVLAARDNMDEDPQDDKEVRTPSPKQDQPASYLRKMSRSLYHYPLCRLAILCHHPHAHDLESLLTISPSTYALPLDRFDNNVSLEEEVTFLNLSHLRSFGCLCYAALIKGSDKFSEKSKKCVLIGYVSDKKAYKLFSLENRNILYSRDVKFYETIFPYKMSVQLDVEQDETESEVTNLNFFDCAESDPKPKASISPNDDEEGSSCRDGSVHQSGTSHSLDQPKVDEQIPTSSSGSDL
uniref:Retrovirus-related Pol polyprotein from transposon TNT 1-94 n=1 Tax=Tanacetum cinerariifolium TaxID=118510 RepID=A0A6L2MBD2_TANCI|nr:retrovirus-related Pol polyprotein from transposon TNT 1-94 [Tanacetum cinerariifolium]